MQPSLARTKKARLTSATTRAGVSLKLELVEQAVTSGRYFDYYDLQLLRGALSDLRALS
jgi:hypothetical protein